MRTNFIDLTGTIVRLIVGENVSMADPLVIGDDGKLYIRKVRDKRMYISRAMHDASANELVTIYVGSLWIH